MERTRKPNGKLVPLSHSYSAPGLEDLSESLATSASSFFRKSKHLPKGGMSKSGSATNVSASSSSTKLRRPKSPEEHDPAAEIEKLKGIAQDTERMLLLNRKKQRAVIGERFSNKNALTRELKPPAPSVAKLTVLPPPKRPPHGMCPEQPKKKPFQNFDVDHTRELFEFMTKAMQQAVTSNVVATMPRKLSPLVQDQPMEEIMPDDASEDEADDEDALISLRADDGSLWASPWTVESCRHLQTHHPEEPPADPYEEAKALYEASQQAAAEAEAEERLLELEEPEEEEPAEEGLTIDSPKEESPAADPDEGLSPSQQAMNAKARELAEERNAERAETPVNAAKRQLRAGLVDAALDGSLKGRLERSKSQESMQTRPDTVGSRPDSPESLPRTPSKQKRLPYKDKRIASKNATAKAAAKKARAAQLQARAKQGINKAHADGTLHQSVRNATGKPEAVVPVKASRDRTQRALGCFEMWEKKTATAEKEAPQEEADGNAPEAPARSPRETPAEEKESYQRAVEAFRKLSVDHDLLADRLPAAMQLLGHREPNKKWIKSIITNTFKGKSIFDKEDFLDFVEDYEEAFYDFMKGMFNSFDSNKSGYLEKEEVTNLLRSLGVSTVPGLIQELCEESAWVVEDPDDLTKGTSLKQFVQMYDNLRKLNGFSHEEYDNLMTVFDRYCSEDSITKQHLQWCLNWLGFVGCEAASRSLMVVVDLLRKGSIDRHQFVTLMRYHREDEVEKVKKALVAAGKEDNESVKLEELQEVFLMLGYMAARPAVLEECTESCRLSDKEDFGFEDMYQLLEAYRGCRGFLKTEKHEINEVFNKFAPEPEEVGKEAVLGDIDLTAAIRWLGFPLSPEQVHDNLAEFDLDNNAAITREEFHSLMRRYNQGIIAQVRDAFTEGDKDKSGTLSVDEFRPVLMDLGYVPKPEDLDRIVGTEGGGGDGLAHELPLWEFVEVVERYRTEQRDKLRENEGFTETEVRKLKENFDAKDKDKSGSIANKELSKLMDEVFPDIRKNIDTHDRAKKLLARVDDDGDGAIDFKGYLAIMRQVQDEQSQKAMDHEQSVIKECGYKREEVKEFRRIFYMYDSDGSGDITLKELKMMFRKLIPLGQHQLNQLTRIFKECDSDGSKSMNFPEFLVIMKKVLDEDLGGIQEAAAIQAGNAGTEDQ
eukprot:TRINITY_DN112429_c0_g1_i1.p1 TRINITY_DN112429_c0_g1~~TRINITY_DN112429_c0_g1_i1.p1  ORF type:complete len:1214 (+),score=385.52 TRINITY_DN112429_c0_g1_i1:147-3644(+)